jgi:hypothetical protein
VVAFAYADQQKYRQEFGFLDFELQGRYSL